jgi:tetratricopeptide (TPR) repeat protein
VFTPLGNVALKGLGGTVAAAEVEWSVRADGSAPLPEVLARGDALAFVGRAEEREQLLTAWKEARAGGRRVVLVSGEPGIGKTSLVAEIARRAHDEEGTVLFGRCDEDPAAPYQPFAEALRGYAAAAGVGSVIDQAGPSAAALGRLVPGLLDVETSTETLGTADADTERFWLFESVVTWLTAVAAESPVVLVLDDLHWAGKPTLLLLRHLLRAESLKGVLVLGTYRDTDLGRSHPLADMLADLRRDPSVERVSLAGLVEAEVAEFVAAAGHEVDDGALDLARAVHAETEGNPFFVDQVLRHLAETGAIARQQGRWGRGGSADWMGIPEGVREVIGRRLRLLSDESNAILEAAAVVGREFDLDLVASTADVEIEKVLDAFEAAESARLVAGVGAASGTFTFAHALVRSTILDEVATTRRLRLHRRTALALESRAAVDPSLLSDLAHHYGEAAALGEGANAIRYARLAADHALEGLAYEEAAALLQRAIDVLDPKLPADQRARADLLLGYGRALWSAGDRATADTAFWEVVELARRLDDPELLAEAAIDLSGRRGWREAGVSNPDTVALLEDAMARLPAVDSPLRAVVLSRLAGELYFVTDSFDRRVGLRQEAIAMAERIGDPRTRLPVLDVGFGGVVSPDGLSVPADLAQEIVDLAQQVGDLGHQINGLGWCLYNRLQTGDLDAAEHFVERERVIAERVRQPEYLWSTMVHLATVAMARGRIEEAERHANEALAMGQSAGIETALQMFGIFEISRRRLVGGIEEMRPLTEAMVEQYPRVPAWRTGLAYISAELDDLEAAAEHLTILAADDFSGLPVDGNWPVGMALCAYAATRVGDRDLSAAIADQMPPLDGWFICAGMPADCLGASEVFRGMASLSAGRLPEGEALLEVGIARNRSAGMPLWVAHGEREWGRLALRHGDPDKARALLTSALDTYDRLGATRLAGLTRADIASTDQL